MTIVFIIIALLTCCWYFAFLIDYEIELFYNTHVKSFLYLFPISCEHNEKEKFSDFCLYEKHAVKSEKPENRLRKNLETLNYLNILEFNSSNLLCPERITEIRELKKNVQMEVIRISSQIQNKDYHY